MPLIIPDERVVARCNEISEQIIGAAIEVHRHFGSGLLESAYEGALERELELRGLRCERQLILPVEYKGRRMEQGYRLDLRVENLIIVELKAVERVETVYETQLLTYLRLSHLYLGLILNFGQPRLKDGISRVINPQEGHNLTLLTL